MKKKICLDGCKHGIMLLISHLLTGNLVVRMFIWKSNADDSDGLATFVLRLP